MKTILITGAASGVGYHIAKLKKDNHLILIDRNESGLKKVCKELGAEGYACDISDIKQVKELFKNFKSKKIDVLVNCAGLWTKGELSKQEKGHIADINSYERIKDLIDTNTFGTISMIKNMVPIMTKQGGGQIVNINSQSGVVVEEFCPVYNASKQGSRAFSKAIIADLAKANIRLTDVCPGLIKTDFYANANDPLSQEIMKAGLEPETIAKLVGQLIDMPEHITVPCVEIKDIKNY